jgi:hypothetical protein
MTPEQQRAVAIAKAKRARAAAEIGASPPPPVSSGAMHSDFERLITGEPAPKLQRSDFRNDPIATTALDGYTFGLGDNVTSAITAGLVSPFSDRTFGDVYNAEQSDKAKAIQFAQENSPKMAMAANIGGSVLSASGLAKGGLTLAGRGGTTAMTGIKGLMARSGLMAAEGEAYNAASAVGHNETYTPGLGLLAGAGGNVVGEGLAAGASKLFGAATKKAVVPSYDEIAAQAAQKYRAADAEGVIYSPSALKGLLSNVEGDFASRTFEPIAQPGANVAYGLLKKRIDAGQPMTAEGLKAIRSIAGEQFIPGKASNNALLNMVKQRIDDFSMNPNPSNVIAGNAPKAAMLRKEADKLYSQQKKIETVRKAVDLAEHRAARTGNGGNLENTVKQELDKISTSPKKGRGFTPDELAAVDDVVKNQTFRDVLRTAGKLSPFRHGGAALVGGAGMLYEPVTAGLLMAAGTAARGLGGAIQKSKVKKIERLIAAGGNTAALKVPKTTAQKLIESNHDTLARLMMFGGLAAASPK